MSAVIKQILCIVIPTFNRREYLKRLLIQLKNQVPSDFQIYLIVVDDGSMDGTIKMLKDEFSDVQILSGDGNWWYTRSMNEGFKFSQKFKPEYILTLNDDLELDSTFLKEIIKTIDTVGNASIIGSLSLTKELPRRVTSSGVYKINRIFGKFYTYHKFLEEVDSMELKGIHKSFMLPGRGMLIPVEVLIRLKYFDEKFPQYHSDGDFCLRALQNGFDIYVNWDAQLYSHHKLTSDSSSYKKKTFSQFLKSFFEQHSRNHIGQNIRFIWRHQYKIFSPLIISIFFFTRFRSFLRQCNQYDCS